MRQRACQTAFVVAEARRARSIAVGCGGGDPYRTEGLAGAAPVLALQARAGQEHFDAARLAAKAGRAGALAFFGPGHRVMAPFACDRVGSDQYMATDDDAGADAGAEDDAEDGFGARAAAVGCLR